MRAIVKTQGPPSLIAHRQTPHSDYDNYPDKDEARQELVGEQRGLCCYCMSRIRPECKCHENRALADARTGIRASNWTHRNLLGA